MSAFRPPGMSCVTPLFGNWVKEYCHMIDQIHYLITLLLFTSEISVTYSRKANKHDGHDSLYNVQHTQRLCVG
jgi:hypothetical protein